MKELSVEQIRTTDISELPQTRIPPPKDGKRDDIIPTCNLNIT